MKTIIGKIDILYAALLSTQEQYFNAQSNNQVIRLRMDLKDGAIERKKILLLSNPSGVSIFSKEFVATNIACSVTFNGKHV